MYAIIYWRNDDEIFPHLTADRLQLKLYDKIEEADNEAYELEKRDNAIYARVISIEGVKA